jgi:hypothetical protein
MKSSEEGLRQRANPQSLSTSEMPEMSKNGAARNRHSSGGQQTVPEKFYVRVTVNRDKILIIKPTRCTDFLKFLFWNETLHVSENSSVHHQEFLTVHSTMVYVIQVCRQLSSNSSRIRMERSSILILLLLLLLLESCLQTCMTYTIAECTVNNS